MWFGRVLLHFAPVFKKCTNLKHVIGFILTLLKMLVRDLFGVFFVFFCLWLFFCFFFVFHTICFLLNCCELVCFALAVSVLNLKYFCTICHPFSFQTGHPFKKCFMFLYFRFISVHSSTEWVVSE